MKRNGGDILSTMNIKKGNKLGTMPIGKLLFEMSVPIMFSMFIQSFYNIVDSMFVARISESAMTAVTLAFPIMNMVIALAIGTGTGIATLISQSLGEKNQDLVNSAAEHAIFIYILYSIGFMFFALLGSKAFILSQTNDAEVIYDAISYLKIASFFAGATMFQIMFCKFFQSTGYSILSMKTQASGAIVNMILDPILIFGYFGFPALGVNGAAIATVLGQVVAVFVGIYIYKHNAIDIHIDLKRLFKPRRYVLKRIYVVGIPSILMVSIGSVMAYLMNLILIGFSNTATAFFGVYFKLQSVVFMPIFGLSNGLIPILAYNYGSKNKQRMIEAIKKSLVYAVSIMSFGTLMFHVIPSQLLDLFNASNNMKSFGIDALKIISISYPLAAVGIMAGSMNQALSKSIYSLIISLIRQLVVLIPVAYLFSLSGNLLKVWWAFPISELASFVASILFFRHLYKTKIACM